MQHHDDSPADLPTPSLPGDGIARVQINGGPVVDIDAPEVQAQLADRGTWNTLDDGTRVHHYTLADIIEVAADSTSSTGVLRPADLPRGPAAQRGEAGQRHAAWCRRSRAKALPVYRAHRTWRQRYPALRSLAHPQDAPPPGWVDGARRESQPHAPPPPVAAGAMTGPSATGAAAMAA